MSIPDAPWIGKCREDYYGCDEEDYERCEACHGKHHIEDLIGVDGRILCHDCFEAYYRNEEDDEDEELYG